MADVAEHLIYNCEDQLKVLGRSRGSAYVRRQIAFWREHYGPAVSERVRGRLIGKYDETPQPDIPITRRP